MTALIDFTFDDKAPAAEKAAKAAAARLVTGISKDTEAAIRTLIAEAIREGIPPYDAARLIKGLIGLTASQGQAAMKYRRELIDGGLAIASVDKKVAAYADELLATRAETIARYEIMDALNDGQNAAWAQAQDEGLLSASATKEWILTDDACELCVAAAAQGPVPVADEFRDGDPPLHPRCRCTTGIATP